MGNFLSILAIILVIPLGIATNLLTPKFLNWYSNYSVRTRINRIKFLKEELEEKRIFLQNTSKLLAYGLISILRILILSTLSGLILYFLNIFKVLTSGMLIGVDELNFVVYFFLLLLNYLTAIVATRDMRLFREIYKFDKYEAKVKKDIAQLENRIAKAV